MARYDRVKDCCIAGPRERFNSSVDLDGANELWRAVASKSWQDVRIPIGPFAARVTIYNSKHHKDGDLPLLVAIERGAPETLVLALLRAYPMGASVPKRSSNCTALPLHLAIMKFASPNFIGAILEAYPEAAREWSKTRMGGSSMEHDLPLHLYMKNKSTIIRASVQASLEANHEVAYERIAQALLQQWPPAAHEPDAGALLLHWALVHRMSDAFVQALLQGYPHAAQKRAYDKWGISEAYGGEPNHFRIMAMNVPAPQPQWKIAHLGGDSTPLGLALLSKRGEAIIWQVLEAFPEACDPSTILCALSQGRTRCLLSAFLSACPALLLCVSTCAGHGWTTSGMMVALLTLRSCFSWRQAVLQD